MSATAIVHDNRAEILQEIATLEMRLSDLRAQLQIVFQKFYVFITDKRRIWIYANNEEQSREKLQRRMDNDYAEIGWKILSSVVKVYNDPIEAAANAPGNLLNSLSRPDALEFLRDYHANIRGRVSRPKNWPYSGLERDIQAFEVRLRMEERRDR